MTISPFCSAVSNSPRKNVARSDTAVARGRSDLDAGIGSDQGHRVVRGRVGMGDRAADRAPGAHRRIGDDACGLRQQRRPGRRNIELGQLGMRGHGADAQAAVGLRGDAAQLGDAAQADEPRRRDEAEIHHRHQGLPAGKAERVVGFEGPVGLLEG